MAAAMVWALGAAALGLFGGWRSRIAVLLGVAVIATWWSTLRPRNDRDWQPEVAVLAYATREDDRLMVHNIRNFEYRTATDFTPVYDTRTYDLANLSTSRPTNAMWSGFARILRVKTSTSTG